MSYTPPKPLGESLFDLAFQFQDVHDPDIVLLCSGIEHHPQKLKKLEMKSEIAGNTPEKI
ncbi:hypothetical protein AKJ65_07020 [candidate division MSBL1 archaeon SCGC-AAA259E19]|uniref:Uncharacterized protein n=1 Tax=candidate division MSBL1 archaeon SCGC-AAA259E19 TaxID=1698264 RepID=A0A133UF53_9EURY|nr:hypothetical protein AKJ65_07020 [candidate division MSBL1 archaeon SCGC-AAA259E19]